MQSARPEIAVAGVAQGPARYSRRRSRLGSIAAVTIGTSGCARCNSATPGGQASTQTNCSRVRSGGLHDRDGFGRALAGREHRIEHEHLGCGDIFGQPAIIFDRAQGFRIAIKPDMASARFRD